VEKSKTVTSTLAEQIKSLFREALQGGVDAIFLKSSWQKGRSYQKEWVRAGHPLNPLILLLGFGPTGPLLLTEANVAQL
jgi:hypothetical protein